MYQDQQGFLTFPSQHLKRSVGCILLDVDSQIEEIAELDISTSTLITELIKHKLIPNLHIGLSTPPAKQPRKHPGSLRLRSQI